MLLLDILTFLGHLHPLIVHLPIGFLLLAALLNLLSYVKRYGHLGHAVSFILLLGFISAVLACIFGYLLSQTGDYDADQLGKHRLTGIALAILSGLLCLLTMPGIKKLPPRVFTFLLLTMTVLVSYSGHLGGGLTHGSDYLSMTTLREGERKIPDNPDDALVFEDIVHPILEKKCAQCHQGGKIKGNLSVQTWETLLKGGKHGPAVTPGKLQESQLYKRVTLDPSNEKYMPSDKKPPLTKQELAIITWWIEKGDAARGKKLSELKDHAAIRPLMASFMAKASGSSTTSATSTSATSSSAASSQPAATSPSETAAQSAEDSTGPPVQHLNPDIPQSVNPSLVDNLRKKGWMVRTMLQTPAMLDVTLPAGSHKKTSLVRDELAGLEKNIVWLNLSDNGFTDGDLAFLRQLSNLEKLRLEKNPLTDSISGDLTALRHLETVNLNETKLTSNGLARLEKNPSLKRIYTWRTAVKQP